MNNTFGITPHNTSIVTLLTHHVWLVISCYLTVVITMTSVICLSWGAGLNWRRTSFCKRHQLLFS